MPNAGDRIDVLLQVKVGDVDSSIIEKQIKEKSSKAPKKNLPKRENNYYELKLQPGWQITQLQYKESAISEVAVIFRSDDGDSRDYDKNP